jgi:hypothetical protein
MKKFKSATILILVSDKKIGNNNIFKEEKFVGSFIHKKLNEFLADAKNQFPLGKIDYKLFAHEYVQSKKFRFMMERKTRKISLSQIDRTFA